MHTVNRFHALINIAYLLIVYYCEVFAPFSWVFAFPATFSSLRIFYSLQVKYDNKACRSDMKYWRPLRTALQCIRIHPSHGRRRYSGHPSLRCIGQINSSFFSY